MFLRHRNIFPANEGILLFPFERDTYLFYLKLAQSDPLSAYQIFSAPELLHKLKAFYLFYSQYLLMRKFFDELPFFLSEIFYQRTYYSFYCL